MGIVVGDAKELNVNSKSVCQFYEQYWKRKIALSNHSFYEWQFTGSPSDAGDDHCMLAMDDSSNQLVGVMGLNTRPFYIDGSIVNGAELTTWMVDEKHFGKGVGAKILKKIQGKYDVLIGMGITDAALSVYMRSGFRYIRTIPRYVKVFDFDSVAAHAKHDMLAKKLAKQWSVLGNDVPFESKIADSESIELLQPLIGKQLNFFSRDYKFLEWRYVNHPVFDYQQYVIHSKGGKGKGVYVALREETSIENLKILHVMDFIGDQSDMPAAISFIHDYCTKNKVHLADFYCTATTISRHFISSGWFSINDDLCFQFPHLFHPMELRIPPTTSLIYWSRDDFLEMSDISRLYITKQDSDLDRPTMDTYEKLSYVEQGGV